MRHYSKWRHPNKSENSLDVLVSVSCSCLCFYQRADSREMTDDHRTEGRETTCNHTAPWDSHSWGYVAPTTLFLVHPNKLRWYWLSYALIQLWISHLCCLIMRLLNRRRLKYLLDKTKWSLCEWEKPIRDLVICIIPPKKWSASDVWLSRSLLSAVRRSSHSLATDMFEQHLGAHLLQVTAASKLYSVCGCVHCFCPLSLSNYVHKLLMSL